MVVRQRRLGDQTWRMALPAHGHEHEPRRHRLLTNSDRRGRRQQTSRLHSFEEARMKTSTPTRIPFAVMWLCFLPLVNVVACGGMVGPGMGGPGGAGGGSSTGAGGRVSGSGGAAGAGEGGGQGSGGATGSGGASG